MRLPDPDRIRAIVSAVAREEILPRFRRLEEGQIRAKSHANDLVTDADIAAETVLGPRLSRELPGSLVIGEEAVHEDPSLLDRLTGDRPVWVIDPVDGTMNFAHGRPTFGTVVALVVGGETLQGWLHDPIRGTTVTAEKGGGAWLGGQRLHVAGKGQPLARLSGSSGFRPAKALQGRFYRHVRHSSAAHDYMAMVEGRMHFAVYRRLMPWDHAAGVLAHTEAGGYSALIGGEPYRPTLRRGTLIAAPDEAAWNEIHDLLATDPRWSQPAS